MKYVLVAWSNCVSEQNGSTLEGPFDSISDIDKFKEKVENWLDIDCETTCEFIELESESTISMIDGSDAPPYKI